MVFDITMQTVDDMVRKTKMRTVRGNTVENKDNILALSNFVKNTLAVEPVEPLKVRGGVSRRCR